MGKKEQPLAIEGPLVGTMGFVLNPELIKVQTIKKSHVQQLPLLTYPKMVQGAKHGTFNIVGIVWRLKDVGDVIVAQHYETGRLCQFPHMDYLQYLNAMFGVDYKDATTDEIRDMTQGVIDQIPQLFAT